MIQRERLRQLKEALLFGEALDLQTRHELIGLLELLAHLAPASRGRPVDEDLRRRAGIVGILIEKHGVPVKAALYAAAPDADLCQRKNIERAYQRLRRVEEVIQVPEALVRAALARLGR